MAELPHFWRKPCRGCGRMDLTRQGGVPGGGCRGTHRGLVVLFWRAELQYLEAAQPTSVPDISYGMSRTIGGAYGLEGQRAALRAAQPPSAPERA
eukprot:3931977-Rhodomonas_salina.2